MNKQIESRINLLNFYINKLTDDRLEKRIVYEYIMLITKQIQNLLEKELLIFFTEDIKNLPQEYKKTITKRCVKRALERV